MTNKNKSILGHNWQKRQFDERLALSISQKFDKSITLSRLLAIKEIELDEVENFLAPLIKYNLPDPFLLLDMDLAAAKIIEAIKGKKKIVIFGDYDVDGATSSALLKRFLAMCGIDDAQIYIPDRILEGYGPNADALLNLKKSGADLIITVDCGTVAFEPLQTAHEAGLEVIVIDHHLGAMEKPAAIAVINPNRLDEKSIHKNLAAVGVCFLLAVAVNKLLKEENFYQKNNLAEPQLLSLLDLVALGTVCDVVPLNGVNRALVSQGLKVMKSRSNLGIKTLCDIAGLSEEPNSYHLGFVIGPRINAGGRVGKSDLGANLLSTNDENKAKEIAELLNIHNHQRKDLEKNVIKEALEKAEKMKDSKVLVIASENWHPGVIGIVASRVKEFYNKPTAIIALDNKTGKASCRSISGVDFGSAIVKARLSKIVIEGGGHAMAAGFSIKEDKIDELREFLNAELGAKVDEINQNQIREFNDILDINSANLGLAKEISLLEPFGSGNFKPKFLIKDLIITKADVIGKDGKHVSCIFSAKTLAGWQGVIYGIAFGAMENELGKILISKNNSRNVGIIAQINLNNWMGNEKMQAVIEDVLV